MAYLTLKNINKIYPNGFHAVHDFNLEMHDYKPMDMVNFAVASSVIKHTIHGDGNIIDDAETIRNLMNMNYDIKR